jgi:hypothetical protein
MAIHARGILMRLNAIVMKRNEEVDFFKGLLMLGVIWGHTITSLKCGSTSSIWIHTFFRTYDMPFFMVISGFFLSYSAHRYTTVTLIKNKLTTIALPAAVWSLVFYHHPWNNYFLWAVFVSSVIVILTCALIKHSKIRIICFTMITLAFHTTNMYIWNLPYLFPFFVLGYYGVFIRKWGSSLKIALPLS